MASGRKVSAADAPVAGLDGCPAGWVLATVPSTPAGARTPRLEIRVIDRLETVADDLASGRLAAAAIDIPIGLPPRGPRACDVAARRMLGPRRSAVFPAPARAVLPAEGYQDACARSRAASGTAISKQLFNILPKIREVDRLLARSPRRPKLQAHLLEMCPELSFAVLTGEPMRSAKRTGEGWAARLAALRPVFGDIAELVARPPTGAARDDVLDALVGAWTAGRFARGTYLQLGGEVDETGLRMEIVA